MTVIFDMIFEFAKAALVLTALVSGWLAVQLAWRRVFSGIPADEDALADRLGCHGCACPTPCEQGGGQGRDNGLTREV